MYEVQIPDVGCSVYYGTYVDTYYNNIRYRYYLNEDHLVLNSTQSYNQVPSGLQCVSQGSIVYKPELTIYFPFLAFALCLLALLFVYKVIIKRLTP